jgi:PilZ domain-containing protein
LAVRYRRVDEDEWRRGETENISHTGVLMRIEDAVAIDTLVELRLRLAREIPESESAEVCCRGRVVRTVPPSGRSGWHGSAVAIEQYDFLPPSADFLLESHP